MMLEESLKLVTVKKKNGKKILLKRKKNYLMSQYPDIVQTVAKNLLVISVQIVALLLTILLQVM